jgi:hypothetical protein
MYVVLDGHMQIQRRHFGNITGPFTLLYMPANDRYIYCIQVRVFGTYISCIQCTYVMYVLCMSCMPHALVYQSRQGSPRTPCDLSSEWES